MKQSEHRRSSAHTHSPTRPHTAGDSYLLQTVARMENDGRQQNVEEDLGVKGHLEKT